MKSLKIEETDKINEKCLSCVLLFLISHGLSKRFNCINISFQNKHLFIFFFKKETEILKKYLVYRW